MWELTKRISLWISSVLSSVEPEPDLCTASDQKVPATVPQHCRYRYINSGNSFGALSIGFWKWRSLDRSLSAKMQNFFLLKKRFFKLIIIAVLRIIFASVYIPVLRSRHFFGRFWLRKSEVLEPTPAPTKLGRLRLSAKKKAAPAPCTNIFHFELLKSELLMKVFFGSHLPL